MKFESIALAEGEERLKQTYEEQISSLEQKVETHRKSFDDMVKSRFSEVRFRGCTKKNFKDF